MLIFSNHAKKRMVERDISINEIQEVIDFPDYTVRKENIVEAQKKFVNRELRIVYSMEGKFIKIITVIERWK